MPDGVLYKRCGNRRATVCPSCAELYQRDAYHLIRIGLVGGNGVPDDVATHPALFVTLTAPSFGLVHSRVVSPGGRVKPCRRPPHSPALPARARPALHHPSRRRRPATRPPLCLDCYDHGHQVVWNHHAGELWRRTTHRRHQGHPPHRQNARHPRQACADLARQGRRDASAVASCTSTPSSASTASTPTDPDAIIPPPAGLGHDELDAAIRHAAAVTGHTTDPTPTNPTAGPSTWGSQLDVRPIAIRGDGEITDDQGRRLPGQVRHQRHRSHRPPLPPAHRRHHRPLRRPRRQPHRTARRRLPGPSADHPAGGGLRRWAHMLGFGGHFLTKTRRYCITFRILRDRRVIWTPHRTTSDQADDEPDHRSSSACSPTPAPAGAPAATPCSPTPPPP